MQKTIFFIMFILLSSTIYAEKIQSETPSAPSEATKSEKNFNTELKFGFGIDFTANHGSTKEVTMFFNNQFGLSVGTDLNWKIFQKTSGEGAGDLFLGLGFTFQYWVPTTTISPENIGTYDTISLHYMRLPVIFNISYDFKVDAGVLKRVGPFFSIGFNNNFFVVDYPENGDSDDDYDEDYDDDYAEYYDGINHWKIGGTWAIGLKLLFDNSWFLKTSIGGDFGSGNYRSDLFYKYHDSKGYHGYFLYGHHEFMMFETGYRF